MTNKEKKETLNRLEIIRIEKGLSREEFSNQWGVKGFESVKRNLRNYTQPTLHELKIASDVFNVPLRELITNYIPSNKSDIPT